MANTDDLWRLYRRFETDRLIKLLEIAAHMHADNHFTILRFTGHYKVMLGTPDLDAGAGRGEVACLPAWTTLKDALIDCLIRIAQGRPFVELRDPEHPFCPFCQSPTEMPRERTTDDAGRWGHLSRDGQDWVPCLYQDEALIEGEVKDEMHN